MATTAPLAARAPAGSLLNAAHAATDFGAITIHQYVTGGRGGDTTGASGGPAAGAGGAAYSGLTFDDALNPTQAYSIKAVLKAYGGRGGIGYSGATGGAGGAGVAVASFTGGSLNVLIHAVGGFYGAGVSGGAKGTEGSAKAKLVDVSSGYDQAGATASGGGSASAKVKASGTNGYVGAESSVVPLLANSLVTAANANAGAIMSGAVKAVTKAKINAAPTPFTTVGTSVALITGLPNSASTTAILGANSNIKTAFGVSPVFFGVGELGGAYTTGGAGSEQIAGDLRPDGRHHQAFARRRSHHRLLQRRRAGGRRVGPDLLRAQGRLDRADQQDLHHRGGGQRLLRRHLHEPGGDRQWLAERNDARLDGQPVGLRQRRRPGLLRPVHHRRPAGERPRRLGNPLHARHVRARRAARQRHGRGA